MKKAVLVILLLSFMQGAVFAADEFPYKVTSVIATEGLESNTSTHSIGRGPRAGQ